MPLTDFVINKHKVALDSCVSCLDINESGLWGILLSLFLPKRSLNDIKPGSFSKIWFFYKSAMGCRNLCDLILHNSEHFSNCKVDAACKFFLVIDLEPSVENLDYLGFQNLGNAQISKFFVLQNGEVLLSFRTFAECLAVWSLGGNFSEVGSCIAVWSGSQLHLTCSWVFHLRFLESLGAFQIDNSLNNV